MSKPSAVTKMIAFHSDPAEKSAILTQLRAHARADEIVKGVYWKNGKGCAVGCTIHSGNHAEYESRFGIPQMLAQLEDAIFEGLPNGSAKKWPVRFMSAITPGSDLSRVGWQFLHWLLTDEKVNPGINDPLVRDAVKQCADVLVRLAKGKSVDKSAESAAFAARSAARSARSAAESGARSAAWSAARSAAWSARSAAESGARSAASGESGESAASNAAWSARSAAESGASAAYSKMSDKLIALIEAVK